MNKLLTALFGLGALVLASCSNDELVVAPTTAGGADTPIGFAVSKGNVSRAGTQSLATEHWDFGVWAYKGTDAPAEVIMPNYLVGYWSGTKGYNPIGGQQLNGSSWYYEWLGSAQSTAWNDADGDHDASYSYVPDGSESGQTSVNAKQYLKYWDRGFTNNWFYAYTPYDLAVEYDNGAHTLTFPEISSVTGADENAMYAVAKVATPTSSTNTKVNLDFNRLLAKVRLAFYEVVDGYSVELIKYKDGCNIPATDPWAIFEDNAMFAVPAKVGSPKYTLEEYVTSGAPVITFSTPDYTTASVNFSPSTKTSTTLNVPLWFRNPLGTQTNLLGTTKETAIINDSKDVLPQAADSDCGFTVNLSLKFTALDTNEVITVKGVRVHIPAEDCRWEANHLYTYYFKVTKTVPGTSSDPGNPDPTPGDDPYLLPIIFDQVTVEDISTVEHEYNLNPVTP